MKDVTNSDIHPEDLQQGDVQAVRLPEKDSIRPVRVPHVGDLVNGSSKTRRHLSLPGAIGGNLNSMGDFAGVGVLQSLPLWQGHSFPD